MIWVSKDPVAKRVGRGGGGEPKQKRSRSIGVDTSGGRGSSSCAAAMASESHAHPESTATMLVDVAVEDADALDCIVCYLPLKPPIFQCDVGHAVCSRCHDKLQATGKCPVCRVVTGRFRRCYAMERLVESIRVPCVYAAHGCASRPVYYDQESHSSVCVHAPCHCPGEACNFVGSKTMLLDHVSTTHKWPCITKAKSDDNEFSTIGLHDGFNFLLTKCFTSNAKQGVTAGYQCLLLLTVVRQPYVRIISVHCIDPHAAAGSSAQGVTSKEMQCLLEYSLSKDAGSLSGNIPFISSWRMQLSTFGSRFRVVRTDFSNGLPKPDDCFQVVVPNSFIEDHDKDGIKVKIQIVI